MQRNESYNVFNQAPPSQESELYSEIVGSSHSYQPLPPLPAPKNEHQHKQGTKAEEKEDIPYEVAVNLTKTSHQEGESSGEREKGEREDLQYLFPL